MEIMRLLGAVFLFGIGYAVGLHFGRQRGRLEATRAEIRRTDTLLHRWRTEQRP